MPQLDAFDLLYVVTGLFLQAVLVAHFALRKWAFAVAMRYGVAVYALAFPVLVITIVLIAAGKPWYQWTAGILFVSWAVVAYVVDVVWRVDWRPVGWRGPIRAGALVPYLALYLAHQMFFWWPLLRYGRGLWLAYTVLYVVSTVLNVTSHRRAEPP